MDDGLKKQSHFKTASSLQEQDTAGELHSTFRGAQKKSPPDNPGLFDISDRRNSLPDIDDLRLTECHAELERYKKMLIDEKMHKGGSKRRRPKRTKRRPSRSRSKLSKKKKSKKSKKKRKKTRRRRR